METIRYLDMTVDIHCVLHESHQVLIRQIRIPAKGQPLKRILVHTQNDANRDPGHLKAHLPYGAPDPVRPSVSHFISSTHISAVYYRGKVWRIAISLLYNLMLVNLSIRRLYTAPDIPSSAIYWSLDWMTFEICNYPRITDSKYIQHFKSHNGRFHSRRILT